MKEQNPGIWVPNRGDLERVHASINTRLKEIGTDIIDDLVSSALSARKHADSPYSDHPVGAAVLTTSGEIYTGSNAEVVSFTSTIHAEQAAISSAIRGGSSERSRQFIEAIAVVGPEHSGSLSGPCGLCRQWIREHSNDALILLVDGKGVWKNTTSLEILLPLSFGPENLKNL